MLSLLPLMDAPQSPAPIDFPSATAWSIIIDARDRNSPDWESSFDLLIRRYWRPVCWYLRTRLGCSRENAEDLTQEFFERLYHDPKALRGAEPERGRFRAFLKLQLRSFAIDDWRSRTAQKRGGATRVVSLDSIDEGGEDLPGFVQPGASPEEAFDRIWALGLLSSALEILREQLLREGRDIVYQALWSCTLAEPAKSYLEAAQDLGVRTVDVGHYLARARTRLRKILLRLIADSVRDEPEAQEELLDLLGVTAS